MTQVFQQGLQVHGKPGFPASRKVYSQGSRRDLRVPFREVTLTPTTGRFGQEENAPLSLYDTSGPYTDEAVELDVRRGLPPLRGDWIFERGDVEESPGEMDDLGRSTSRRSCSEIEDAGSGGRRRVALQQRSGEG